MAHTNARDANLLGTLSLAVYMYYESFSNGSWAYGSAVAVVLGAMVIAVSAALAVVQSRVEKRIR